MKITVRFIIVTSISIVTSSSLYATNGDILIGVGAKTRSMGGAGIAFSHGAESTLVNPALITEVTGREISFGGTLFVPDISTEIVPYTVGGKRDSDADLSVVPAVALATKIDDRLYIGTGMWGTAGVGIDFRGDSSLMEMETTLQLMQFAVPIAYKFDNGLSIGVSPILQYGSLDIHYKMPPALGGATIGDGQNQDFGFGASIGAFYDFNNGLTVGAVYKSSIEMSYGESLSKAVEPFKPLPNFPNIGDKLEQPAEYGVGIGYTFGNHSIAFDYKKIEWGSAKGYKEFGWKDQNVYSFGYQYSSDCWSVRVGYNHGSNPIKEFDGTGGDVSGASLNMFNLLGFPATSRNHLTFGGTYIFNENFSLDLTGVYGFKSSTSTKISALSNIGMTGVDEISNDHSEMGLTVQLNYKF
jgi:long-chain fatty acid transport protein